jgi:uracil-DNA glycosylase family 4
VADLRRTYLRQLAELGERDVLLPGGRADERTDAPAHRRTDSADAPARVAEETVAPQPGVAALSSGIRLPVGLNVGVPASRADLFSVDPVGQLATLDAVAGSIDACRRCGLGGTRQHSVPGEGDPRAGFVCVGEAPGATEDETGRPFVGRAGKLLEDILRAIGFQRENVFICNVLKCRPPNNRDPEPLEVQACAPYLHRQLDLIRPKVILALGRPAAHALLATTGSLGDLRGRVHRYRGIPLVVTYHPAALLRNPNWKRPTWDDVRIARRIYDGEAV